MENAGRMRDQAVVNEEAAKTLPEKYANQNMVEMVDINMMCTFTFYLHKFSD